MSSPGQIHEDIVQILEAHQDGLSYGEVRAILQGPPFCYPASEQAHLDRRMRDLPKWWVVRKIKHGTLVRYVIMGRRRDVAEASTISGRVRAQVLQESRGRCAMCGESVQRDGITLQIGHKIPESWGGTNDSSNLQALCVRCNHGKRDYFASMNAELMRRVVATPSVHERIAIVLSEREGEDVEASVLSLAADQDDWHKRLRELRYLGWEIAPIRRKTANGRHATWYRLDAIGDWPQDMTRAIRAIEAGRKRLRRGSGATDRG